MRTGQSGPGIRKARRKLLATRPKTKVFRAPRSTSGSSLSGLTHSSTNYTRTPRMSQSRSMVASGGLQWGGKTFGNSQDFAKWLTAHGSSYATFQRRHSQAALGLNSRSSLGGTGSSGRGGSSIGSGRPSRVGTGGSRGSRGTRGKTKAQLAADRAAKLAQKVSMGTSYHPPGYGPKKKPKKQQSSGGGTGQVAPYTRADGTPVKGYKRGQSQSQSQVQQRGLVWGKRLFHTKSAFGRSLKAHGTSLSRFSTRHPSAFKGLG